LILIDDFGIAPPSDETTHDPLEIHDDRYDRHSTLITGELPIEQWHTYLGDRSVDDAMLDPMMLLH
jgi:DNA replication protein DnaC